VHLLAQATLPKSSRGRKAAANGGSDEEDEGDDAEGDEQGEEEEGAEEQPPRKRARVDRPARKAAGGRRTPAPLCALSCRAGFATAALFTRFGIH
jgi:hypothetical protein